MSSGKFVCELRADKRLRQYLVGGAVLATLAGNLLLIAMPLPVAARCALAALWMASSVLELRGVWRGMSRIDRIRIQSDGKTEAIAPDGTREPLELLSGSVVLARMAWLRWRLADGHCCGEWLRREMVEAAQWRRLQLIWRQRAARFGRRQGS